MCKFIQNLKSFLLLQGVIDAAVNGGIAKYQDAFFSAEFLRENPERGDDVARLQRMMLDQVGYSGHSKPSSTDQIRKKIIRNSSPCPLDRGV